MAQILDSEALFTRYKIETWAGTKLDTCPVPNPATMHCKVQLIQIEAVTEILACFFEFSFCLCS